MTNKHCDNLVLAVYPTTRGLGFVVMEGPLSAVDWGTSEITSGNKNEWCLSRITRLIERLHPDTIALPDWHGPEARRSERIRNLCHGVVAMARVNGLDIRIVRLARVKRYFATLGATTKHERAAAVARLIPAFAHRMPPRRARWQTEPTRAALFDAAAVALAYFDNEKTAA